MRLRRYVGKHERQPEPRCRYLPNCECNPAVLRAVRRGDRIGQVHVHGSPFPITVSETPPFPPIASLEPR